MYKTLLWMTIVNQAPLGSNKNVTQYILVTNTRDYDKNYLINNMRNIISY